MNIFEENFEVGYMTNNSPWVNPSNFWDEDLMHLALMPQDHFWTEVPYNYSSQTLNIIEGNLIDQIGQKLKTVNTIESFDSQAFEKVL